MASITFLGGAGTVTGSKFLVEANGRRMLVDCGLFQGGKELRLRNWARLPVAPKDLDAVVLTHAHIDHTGYLPIVHRDGFAGRVYATPATRDLAAILLPDSGHLQEEEAGYANRRGYSKHRPALPLYTAADGERAAASIVPVPYGERRALADGLALSFLRAGHILGSAIVTVEIDEKPRRHRIVFTGDLGRYGAPILVDPDPVREATTLVVESTYGDRSHGPLRPVDALAEAVNRACAGGGLIVVPAFAIGRTQEILYHLHELDLARRIPPVDVYVDSPMAIDATPLYARHAKEHDAQMRQRLAAGAGPFGGPRVHFARTVEQSKKINDVRGNAIVISASGMATGGRVLHHLASRLPDPRNTVLFVGFQAFGTRGRRLVDGEREIKIHGQRVPVRADVRTVSGFSAHADRDEVGRWLSGFERPPDRVLCVHGEAGALAAMKAVVESRGPGWRAQVPDYLERLELN